MGKLSDEKWEVLTNLLSSGGGTLLYNEAKRAREAESELKAELDKFRKRYELMIDNNIKLVKENAKLKEQVERLKESLASIKDDLYEG